MSVINNEKRLEEIISFLKEAEKLKLVERIPYLSDKKRRENDAEHSWYLALLLLAFEKELKGDFDLLQTYKMIVVHDLVEVYTGDDWVYEKEAKEEKRRQEIESAKKLFAFLPKDLEKKFYDLWWEYEVGETKEAKVAKGLDKISYTLQYAISQKIEWNKPNAGRVKNLEYAMPHLKHDPILEKIFKLVNKETPE